MKLPTCYLNPALLRCSRFNGYAFAQEPYAERTVYEYELEYFIRSDGGVRINGRYVPFSAGEINIRKPGQVVQGVPPYECYTLVADLVGNPHRSHPVEFGREEEAQESYENPLLKTLPDKLTPAKKEMIAGLFETILQNQDSPSDLAAFQVRSNLYFLFSELFRESADRALSGNTAAVRRSIQFMREHFSQEISVEELIACSGLSSSSFHRRFLEETGLTPGKYLARLRVEQAKNLLSFTQIPVGEIGALCGYADHVYFARVFRNCTGMSPSAYRCLTEK